jgi:hypothetical protein
MFFCQKKNPEDVRTLKILEGFDSNPISWQGFSPTCRLQILEEDPMIIDLQLYNQ